jgi:LysR family transcriptional regulator, glycine cleavage system transcriptional activator
VSTAPTFGERVLLPRLRRFQEVCPGVAVHIDTSHHVVQFPRDGFDLAIRVGTGSWPGLASVKLLEERLVPVCAPKLLGRRESRGPLGDAALIHVTSASQDWAVWGREAGVDPGDPKRGLMVDTIQLALDAAAQGLGVAIGRRPFIEEELASGVLARFCGPEVPSDAPYWLVAPPETFRRPEIEAFCDWLIAETQALWRRPAGA